MKRISFILLLLVASISAFAQNKPTFSMAELKSKEDMNPMAKKAITYLMSTPVDSTDAMRNDAHGYLFAWMEKTEEYTFEVGMPFANVSEESRDEGIIFIAGMAESAFIDKNRSPEQVNLHAAKRLIEYAKKPANKLTPGPELKKMIKADQKGELAKYLAQEK